MAVLDNGDRILVEVQILGTLADLSGHHVRHGAVELHPAHGGLDGFGLFDGFGQGLLGISDALQDGSLCRLLDTDSGQILGGDQQWLEEIGIAGGQGADRLHRDFFGGDDLPLIDDAVFVQVDPPAGAAHVEPADLIDVHLLRIARGVDLPVDLQTVLVIAILVDGLVPVGIDKSTEGLSLRTRHDITGPLADLDGLDLALVPFGLVGGLDIDHLSRTIPTQNRSRCDLSVGCPTQTVNAQRHQTTRAQRGQTPSEHETVLP